MNPDGSIKARSCSGAGGTQANVGDALNALDAATAAIGDAAVQYDDPLTKDSVTLAGPTTADGGVTGGTRISNLSQGAVTATSSDAINGAQLYNTEIGRASGRERVCQYV